MDLTATSNVTEALDTAGVLTTTVTKFLELEAPLTT
jgi:hypothetical protein